MKGLGVVLLTTILGSASLAVAAPHLEVRDARSGHGGGGRHGKGGHGGGGLGGDGHAQPHSNGVPKPHGHAGKPATPSVAPPAPPQASDTIQSMYQLIPDLFEHISFDLPNPQQVPDQTSQHTMARREPAVDKLSSILPGFVSFFKGLAGTRRQVDPMLDELNYLRRREPSADNIDLARLDPLLSFFKRPAGTRRQVDLMLDELNHFRRRDASPAIVPPNLDELLKLPKEERQKVMDFLKKSKEFMSDKIRFSRHSST